MFKVYIYFFNMARVITKMKKHRKRPWAVRPINLDWDLVGYHTKIFRNGHFEW